MEVKIIQQQYNPLLKRKEIAFEIKHDQTRGTPSRLEVRQKLAEMLKTNLELVYVKRIETKTGTMTARGEANAYDTIEQVKLVEPQHIVERNAPKEKQEAAEKAEEPKKPEKPEKAEKPKKVKISKKQKEFYERIGKR